MATILGFLAIWKLAAITYIYDARPGETGIDFYLLTILKVYALPYRQIESVDVAKGSSGLFVYNFKNRLFTPAFLITKKRGWFARRLLITPASCKEFIRLLHSANVPVKKSNKKD